MTDRAEYKLLFKTEKRSWEINNTVNENILNTIQFNQQRFRARFSSEEQFSEEWTVILLQTSEADVELLLKHLTNWKLMDKKKNEENRRRNLENTTGDWKQP